jgi:hypothetical protein
MAVSFDEPATQMFERHLWQSDRPKYLGTMVLVEGETRLTSERDLSAVDAFCGTSNIRKSFGGRSGRGVSSNRGDVFGEKSRKQLASTARVGNSDP